MRIHKHILYKYAWTKGSPDDVEIRLQIRVAVGVVGTDSLAGKMEFCGIVQAGSKCISPGVSPGGVGAPAGGIVPAVAPAGGIGVDGRFFRLGF